MKKRCVIYSQDVQVITGRSERYAQALLNKIKKFYNKKPHQFVTTREFAEFSGISTQELEGYL